MEYRIRVGDFYLVPHFKSKKVRGVETCTQQLVLTKIYKISGELFWFTSPYLDYVRCSDRMDSPRGIVVRKKLLENLGRLLDLID